MCISYQKILTSQKLSGPLDFSGLKSFHSFLILGGKMMPAALLAFYLAIKLWEVLVWKIFTKNIQNIPLKDYRDSTKNHPKVGKSGLTNSENFVELLMYRVKGGDKTLENHLLNAPQNAKYTSPDIQNGLNECCSDLIVEQLVGEVKESRYYSILADKATDCSLKEQLALSFRFADKENNIMEEFVSFLECSYRLIGQSLYRTI